MLLTEQVRKQQEETVQVKDSTKRGRGGHWDYKHCFKEL